MAKIESKDLAKSIRLEAERVHTNKLYNNTDFKTELLENK